LIIFQHFPDAVTRSGDYSDDTLTVTFNRLTSYCSPSSVDANNTMSSSLFLLCARPT